MNLVWDNCNIDVTSFAGIYRFDMQLLTIFSSKLSKLELFNGSNVLKQTFRGEIVKGFRWVIPVLGLRGLAKRKNQRSPTYALRKWILKFWRVVGQGQKRLIAGVERRLWETSLTARIFQRKGGCWKVIHNNVNLKWMRGFNYRVNMADKAEIFIKYDAKIMSGWSWWDVIAEDIYEKTGQKVFAMTLISNKQEFCFIRIQLQLVFIQPVLDWDKRVLKIVYWIIKTGCVEGIVYLCVICVKVVFDILGPA